MLLTRLVLSSLVFTPLTLAIPTPLAATPTTTTPSTPTASTTAASIVPAAPVPTYPNRCGNKPPTQEQRDASEFIDKRIRLEKKYGYSVHQELPRTRAPADPKVPATNWTRYIKEVEELHEKYGMRMYKGEPFTFTISTVTAWTATAAAASSIPTPSTLTTAAA